MRIVLLLIFFNLTISFSQGYVEYLTGNPNDAVVDPNFGICLMGGASENDAAMMWFLNKANGGDVVVLRSSGSNGYNDYMYSQLGVSVNSVRTFVITSSEGATHPYVLDKVAQAEAVWFAGGDQSNYVQLFKDNAMEVVLNDFINLKGGAIGGTSAGMAILGSAYFSAENGTITNEQALNNPFHNRLTLGYNDFLEIPFLENLITDTHYDNPDRRARHSVFLARYANDNSHRAFGIACNEYTAVCIDSDGKAYVYGEYPVYNEFAFFLQSNCQDAFLPENCSPDTPLTWDRNNQALKVYKVPGTDSGTNYFDLSDWQTANGGEWESWYVEAGQFFSLPSQNPNCADVLNAKEVKIQSINIYPNPFNNQVFVAGNWNEAVITFYDLTGKRIRAIPANTQIDTSFLSKGIYFITIEVGDKIKTFKLIKY